MAVMRRYTSDAIRKSGLPGVENGRMMEDRVGVGRIG